MAFDGSVLKMFKYNRWKLSLPFKQFVVFKDDVERMSHQTLHMFSNRN